MTLLACALAVSALAVTAAEQPRPSIEYRPSLLIQLAVADLDRAISFYTTVLGFTITERRDDLRFAHLDTNVPGLQIGLNAVAEPKGTGSAVLNIGVANVAEARRLLESRGVKFRGETVVIPGKVALAPFADPDGNLLRLAGPPPRPSASEPMRKLAHIIGTWDVVNEYQPVDKQYAASLTPPRIARAHQRGRRPALRGDERGLGRTESARFFSGGHFPQESS
jgi:predicted enzyme related to lactoylglutathione lyase